MTRTHDLGGRPGFGPVPVDDDQIFHADWERRAFAVTQFSQAVAGFNTDAFRHGVEREDPERYLELDYFDKWIRNAERMLVEGGVFASDAVSAAILGTSALGAANRTTDAAPAQGRGAHRVVSATPKFAVGDAVQVRSESPAALEGGHTRLPGYVAGKPGTVRLINDAWVFPDTHAHGQGESPAWVYAVAFLAGDLWPNDNATHTVVVDLFEPYLETP